MTYTIDEKEEEEIATNKQPTIKTEIKLFVGTD